MSVPLTIAGITYDYPVVDSELWGTEATDWAIAVTAQLNNLIVEGDIGPVTLVTINNNQAVAANVTNFTINPASIRSGTAEYYVERATTGPATEVGESGTLYILYNDTSATWSIAQLGNNVGNTGVNFNMTPGGQLQYTSTNLAGATHTGRMKYRLRVLQKT